MIPRHGGATTVEPMRTTARSHAAKPVSWRRVRVGETKLPQAVHCGILGLRTQCDRHGSGTVGSCRSQYVVQCRSPHYSVSLKSGRKIIVSDSFARDDPPLWLRFPI